VTGLELCVVALTCELYAETFPAPSRASTRKVCNVPAANPIAE
jgi:hypothetical protein